MSREHSLDRNSSNYTTWVAVHHTGKPKPVHGTNIRLPFNFFNQSKNDVSSDPFTFVERLKNTMNELKPVPSTNHDHSKTFVHRDMQSCTHVFIRRDGIKKSLQSNYDGPFEVVSRNKKYFLVNVKGKHKQISVDRLKPLFTAIDVSHSNQPSQPSKESSKKVRET